MVHSAAIVKFRHYPQNLKLWTINKRVTPSGSLLHMPHCSFIFIPLCSNASTVGIIPKHAVHKKTVFGSNRVFALAIQFPCPPIFPLFHIRRHAFNSNTPSSNLAASFPSSHLVPSSPSKGTKALCRENMAFAGADSVLTKPKSKTMVTSRRMVVFGLVFLTCIFLLEAAMANNDASDSSKCIHSANPGDACSHHVHERFVDHEDHDDDFDDTFKVVENVAISL
ncbi:uncharacterized protein G2W53_018555 [Senna tora]|uniref:Transmembrane protein n=1 Tax=Senna tora TaxID=362788 RepID=A0A834WPY6_9FABA|nr:uncharacterized protein G2W53_018555 [Senna tora]